MYGSTGVYQSFVTASTAPSVATFFTYLPTSIYYAWLSEYNTTSPAQTIGTGSYGGSFCPASTTFPSLLRRDSSGATVFGPPLAWYNKTYGEIGDICNAQQGTIVLNAVSYTMQKEWSNQKSACILNK